MQRAQVAELAAAWMGPGGDAAVQLLARHCDTADSLATEVRAAAQRCESLRDNLWYLVDSKVATAIAIDDRSQAQRTAWLTAAGAVAAAVGDRDGAEDVVRQQVMPYVDNDIRDDWLTAMRSASDGITTSYGMVTDRMAGAPAASFEFPDDLVPDYPPVRPVPPAAPIGVGPVPTLTAATPVAPVAPAAAVPTPTPAPTPDWGAAPGEASALPAGDLGGLGGLSDLGGGGLGSGSGIGSGGGLFGLAGRIVDAVGDLIGSASDGVGETDSFDDGDVGDDDPFHEEDGRRAGDVDKTDEPDKTDGPDKPDPVAPAQPVEAATPGGPPPNVAPPPDATPVGPPVGTPAAPVAAPAATPDDHSTPCEIAADQLPQAGQ